VKSRRKNLSEPSASRAPEASLRISEVAQRVGISSSALRAWEALGLVTPQRTRSRYRLYNEKDVRLLKRAIFLRRARGLNPAAIVHVLKRQGVVSAAAESVASPGSRFRRLRQRRNLSLAQVARSTGVSVGFLSALERGQMRASIGTLRRIAATIAPIFFPSSNPRRIIRASCGPRNAKCLRPRKAFAWNYSPGATLPWSRIFFESSARHQRRIVHSRREEFLHVLRGEFEIWLNSDERYRMQPGDSLYFQSSTPHRWRNPGKTESWLLWINTPPTF